eukprot:scaffold2613_cov188-Amphora_coffeaeformis.AAC.6
MGIKGEPFGSTNRRQSRARHSGVEEGTSKFDDHSRARISRAYEQVVGTAERTIVQGLASTESTSKSRGPNSGRNSNSRVNAGTASVRRSKTIEIKGRKQDQSMSSKATKRKFTPMGNDHVFHVPSPFHFYKANQPTSQRTQLWAQVIQSMEESKANDDCSAKRKFKKEKKISSLKIIDPVPQKVIPHSVCCNPKDPLCFDGRDPEHRQGPPPGMDKQCWSLPFDSLHVACKDVEEAIQGAAMYPLGLDGNMVFTFIPRASAIGDTMYTKALARAEKKLESREGKQQKEGLNTTSKIDSTRHTSHLVLMHAIDSITQKAKHIRREYAILNKRGLANRNIEGASRETSQLIKFVKICERKLFEWIPYIHGVGIHKVVELFQRQGMKAVEGSSSNIYSSIGFGKGAFLSCHKDEDSLYSQVTVQGYASNDFGYYKVNDPIVCYFCFPTYGVCVAMRPGDTVIFNACVPHCLSSHRNQVDPHYTMALYLKTSCVNKHNNNIPLTPEEQELLDNLS